MPRIDRRDMLKLIAATGGGAAAAASGGLVAGQLPALAANSPSSPTTTRNGGSPATVAAPRVPATPGTTYKTWGMQSFSTLSASVGPYAWNGGAGRYSTTFQELTALVDVPSGAVLTEMFAYVVAPTATDSVWILVQHPYANTFAPVGITAIGAAVGAQTVPLVGFSPIQVDGVLTVLSLEWLSSVTDGTHSIMGYTAGWILNPGLTLFPDPRRVVSGDVTPFTSGTTYGPFDATHKVGGVIASGVPAGASAVFCAVQSYSPGVLTVFPDGAADPGIANYSGTGTSGTGLNMVYMMVPLSAAGKFKIHSYITGKVYVDAWGYVV